MLERKAWKQLETWKRDPNHKALLLTGARQIGKTTLAREFAKRNYSRYAEINFLEDPGARAIFEGAMDAGTIISNLTAYLRTPLEAGDSLVLLDEIQECPNARTAIKFLVEDGRFDYIETGSLLGVNNNAVPSYPVGFEQRLRMFPLDFEEFCMANGVQQATLDMLREHAEQRRPVSPAVHDTMMQLFSTYVVVGGMPEAVQRYVDSHDIAQVIGLQRDLLALYRQDIAKYADARDSVKIRAIFDAIPSQLDDKNRRFVLADLSKTARQERYASSFLWLSDAGVALPCFNVDEPTVPLRNTANRSLFKLFMGDIGLLTAASLSNVQFDVLQGDLEVNMGSLTENVVAQELLAHGFELHYFNSTRQGEVDFVVQDGKRIIPVEVKSGNDWTRHKALDNIMAVSEWHLDEAVVFCKGNIRQEGNICYLPLYMTMFFAPTPLPPSMPHHIDLSALLN